MLTRSGLRRLATAAGAFAAVAALHPVHAQAPSRARLLQPDSVAVSLTRSWPVEYEKLGAGGMIRVRAFVDSLGRPDSAFVTSSTGFERLDWSALGIVRAQRFTPAAGPDGVTASWVELGLQFGEVHADARAVPPPVVLNRDDVVRELLASAPRSVQERPYLVPVPFLLTLHADGRVASAVSPEPGCFPDATEAAERVVRRLRFEPAGDGSARRVTAVTVTYGTAVELIVRGDVRTSRRREPGRQVIPSRPGADRRRPELTNQKDVERALVRHYPPGLAARGVGGTPIVWFHVGEDGNVRELQVSKTSGICAFDVAAMNVAAIMRFTPALVDGVPVPIWVEIPVVFSAR